MAKLTLNKLEKRVEYYWTESFPLNAEGLFTPEAVFDKYGRELESCARKWSDAAARLKAYAEFVMGAHPPFVDKEEATMLRAALKQADVLVDFAESQTEQVRAAAELLADLVDHAHVERVEPSAARKALEAEILAFAGPVLEAYKAAEEAFGEFHRILDTEMAAVPESFRAELSNEVFYGPEPLVSDGELQSVPCLVLAHLFADSEIELFIPDEDEEEDEPDDDEEEDDDEPEEPEDDEE